MKKLILMLLISSSILAQPFKKIDDKALHVYSGILITTGVGSFVYYKTENLLLSEVTGFLAGVSAGIIKESVYDNLLKRGVCSNQDAAATIWGAVVGAIVLRVGIDIKQKHDIEKEYFQNLRDSLFVERLTDFKN